MIYKNDKIVFSDEYCEQLKQIIENKNGKNGVKIKNRILNNCYLEENKIVLFNIITKDKYSNYITALRTSIGYVLPDEKIYDLISSHTYNSYELYSPQNKEREGEFALIINNPFRNSDKKIRMTKRNLSQIKIAIEKYIIKYKKGEAQLKEYSIEMEDEEHIPNLSKSFYNY